MVLASTSEVYGKNDRVPLSEDDDRVLGPTTKSRWSYACSKAIDEFLALAYHREHGLPVVIVRFFNTSVRARRAATGWWSRGSSARRSTASPITVYGDGAPVAVLHGRRGRRARDDRALAGTPAAVGEVFNVGTTHELTIRRSPSACARWRAASRRSCTCRTTRPTSRASRTCAAACPT